MLGQVYGLVHIFFRAEGRAGFIEPDVLQDGIRCTLGMQRTRQRDHRHAHPQGVEGGGGAVVGETVQRDIHLVVPVGMLLEGAVFDELKPILPNAMALEFLQQIVSDDRHAATGRFNDQPGALNALQNLAPCGNDLGIELAHAVERGKGNMAVFLRRRRRNALEIGQITHAQEAFRHVQQFFRVARAAVRLCVRIGDAEIHGGKRRGVGFRQIGDLHRCRLPGQGDKTGMGHVPADLNEHVNAVRMDAVGERLVVQPGDVHEMIRGQANFIGDGIIIQHVGVAINIKAVVIVRSEDGAHELADGMFAEVRGHIGDLHALRRRRWRHLFRQANALRALHDRIAPDAVDIIDDCGRNIGHMIEQHHQIRELFDGDFALSGQRQGVLLYRTGFAPGTGVLEGRINHQFIVGYEGMPAQFERRFIHACGVITFTTGREQPVQGLGVIRVMRRTFFQGFGSLGPLVLEIQRDAQLYHRCGMIRFVFQQPAATALRFLPAALVQV